ncbi:MAG: aspartyl/asparaginyl beta-hydroxylase domain-containing protein [Burkholderiales bacterium]|nr:aspartyl/asparaginyl beta-hydroxylase domain-containing protein [Burkholderiales bacterium]
MDVFHWGTRHWVVLVFVAAALHAHLRGRVRFGLLRALTDYTVLIAPFNSLMVLFSRVGTQPYIDPKLFPELKVLQDDWQAIRDEALRLNDEGHIKAAGAYNDIGFNSFFRTGWKRFYLKWYGQELASAQQLCPRTVELLNSIPGIKAAMFASLPPGARLVQHRDPYAGSLRYHLGLVTPNDPGCYIEVDGQRYHWRDGEVVMFDETYIHHAENTTQQQRVILFCDVERPLFGVPLRWLNRFFARVVMRAAATQNMPGEHVGGINRFFSVAYRLREQAKKLKQRSKPLYYTTKWLLIGGLIYLIVR